MGIHDQAKAVVLSGGVETVSITRWAKITYRFEGFHRYSYAPDNVAYLRNRHRHVFHVTLWIEQFHNERDVEYLGVLHELQKLLTYQDVDDTASCETIAESILDWARGLFPTSSVPCAEYNGGTGRALRCEVLEDGENGALLELNP